MYTYKYLSIYIIIYVYIYTYTCVYICIYITPTSYKQNPITTLSESKTNIFPCMAEYTPPPDTSSAMTPYCASGYGSPNIRVTQRMGTPLVHVSEII